MLIAVPFLAKHHVNVRDEDILKLASNPLYRLPLYNSLKEVNLGKLFPGAYQSQEKFAEGMLMQYMDNEDGAPEVMELLETRWIEVNKEKQKLFVYKYKESEDGEWYLALSGPFKGKELTSDESLTYNTYVPYAKSTLEESIEKALGETGAKLLK
jgi:hypothetical protein